MGRWSTVLGPFAAAAAPAMARVVKAEAVCEALRRYVAAQPDEHARQAAHVVQHMATTTAPCYLSRAIPYEIVAAADEASRIVCTTRL